MIYLETKWNRFCEVPPDGLDRDVCELQQSQHIFQCWWRTSKLQTDRHCYKDPVIILQWNDLLAALFTWILSQCRCLVSSPQVSRTETRARLLWTRRVFCRSEELWETGPFGAVWCLLFHQWHARWDSWKHVYHGQMGSVKYFKPYPTIILVLVL